MLNFIDNFLNRITMYRLVLYVLLGWLIVALGFSALGLLPFTPLALVLSTATILAVSLAVNKIFANVFRAQANVESVYITALILALIITPASTYFSMAGWPFFFWAAAWAMASKFIFAIQKKHIWNPAAFAVALTALTINQSASWWIGTAALLPFVVAGGFLIVRKINRFDLVLSFLAVAFTIIVGSALGRGTGLFQGFWGTLAATPIVFFASVMLTEPLTTPPTRPLRIFYGALVGFLFSPAVHLGSVYSTPELALLAGNVVSFLVSPKSKHLLTLKEKKQVSPDAYDYSFTPEKRLRFQPGQYLEWTLSHEKPDRRGNRRYFTIASSPTEENIKLGVKFHPESSSFKKGLLTLQPGETIMAGQLAGDFILPKNRNKKLAFIAGGIGITPFRSMVKYLTDKKEKRDIILLYSNKTVDDIVYDDVFGEAGRITGLKTVYTLTDTDKIPGDWPGERGAIDARMIKKEMPDYPDRIFYISGPRSFVLGVEGALKEISVSQNHIKTDFFPGFA